MKSAIHICATTNMRKGIYRVYGDDFPTILTVRKFLEKVFPNWYSPEIKLQQYLSFSKSLRDFDFTKPLLKQAFRANTEELLESIRMLVQAGVKPEDFNRVNGLTEKEREFQCVWQYYESINDTLNYHRKILVGRDVDCFKIEKALKRNVKDLVIYLHGFYFITPEQQVFFKFLQRHGVELRFFQYYDPRFPNTFDFIRNFISDDYDWSSKWDIEWPKENEKNQPIATQFLEAYETRIGQQIDSPYQVKKYNTFFDFLHDVIIPTYPMAKEVVVDPQVKIFATNEEEINEVLKTYYPSLDKKNRSFLAHPLGQFLVNIHKVYENGKMCLTGDLLVELFSSGWLVDERTNQKATDYTYDLKLILPYFEGLSLLDDWINRIKNLLVQKGEIQQTFKAASSTRKDRSISNPFNKLSYFSIDVERVSQIKDFIIGIRLLAEDLFIPTEEKNTIDDHFNRLREMMQRRKQSYDFSDDIEKDLIDKLIGRLNTIHDSAEFLYDDIQPALFLYLNGKFDETGSKEEKIVTEFLELDGQIFKESSEEVYFTGLDERSLPLGKIQLPWPLQHGTFEQLSESNTALQLLSNRNASVKEISRFLFFIALNFIPREKLNLSWIVNILDQNDLNAALYTRQLHMEVVPYLTKQSQAIEPPNFEPEITKVIDEELHKAWESLNAEGMLAEYQLCKKRFYYSYILDEYPVFNEDFHQGFIFSEIYKLAAGVENRRIEDVLKEVEPFFPQWNRSKKESMAYDSYGSRYNFESDSSQKMLLNHYFPGLKNDAREPLFNQNTIQIKSELLSKQQSTLEGKPGYNCRFCPHRNYCEDVQYSVDK
nr:hypothetical protein [Lysinibacillus timonensis]